VRDSDTVARLGGDEFAVLLVRLASPAAAQIAADRIRENIERTPFDVGQTQVHLGASIGIACAIDGERSPEALIADADTAMYAAKVRRKQQRLSA
jgi:diguanylate cyclase (GGDEF)-like protein